MSCTMYIPAAPDVKGDKAKSNYCSLGAGGDAVGGWCGKSGFGEHIAGERLVSVIDGARNAVKF